MGYPSLNVALTISSAINNSSDNYDEIDYYNSSSLFPSIGKIDVLYIDKTDKKQYIWDAMLEAYRSIGGSIITIDSVVTAESTNAVSSDAVYTAISQISLLPGPKGDDGISIIGVIDNGDGTFKVMFSDLSYSSNITLPAGIVGANGVSVTGITDNNDGTFKLNFSNGSYSSNISLLSAKDKTAITGILKGDGNSITTANAGSDYVGVDSVNNLTKGLGLKYNSISTTVIDCSVGNFFSKTITTTTAFTVSNVPTSGSGYAFILEISNGGANTVSWMSGTIWASGTPPTLTTAGKDIIGFFTRDGGTVWNGMVISLDEK